VKLVVVLSRRWVWSTVTRNLKVVHAFPDLSKLIMVIVMFLHGEILWQTYRTNNTTILKTILTTI
jgi:hypothetical protein